MLTLLAFAFLAGIITILSPCILPVLPIVLAGSVTGGRRRPLGIIMGFVLSFTFFTLFAFALVSALGLSAETLRITAIIILGLFGASIVVPQGSDVLKKLFSKLANVFTRDPSPVTRSGFGGGLIIGLSLSLVWTPCVGPIMSAVITLAATSSVSAQATLIALFYSLGTAVPMFIIMLGGRALLSRIPSLLRNTENLQKAFGVIMILIAVAMFFGFDRKFQSAILDVFPTYGTNLTKLEDKETIKQNLENLIQDESETRNTLPATSSSPEVKLDMNALLPNRYPSAPNPGFTGATKWLNSEPLTLEKLKGKIVLVDFWTYTCINCIRTLPYLTAWDEKYRDQGLVIIGVHAPEFAFEKEEKNVRQAMEEKNITYPVVQDNDFNIWRSYNNRYWPAKYLIDAQGRVRDTHFGEGAYEETERKIQELLKEAGMANVEKEVTKEMPAERTSSITPETYLGLARMERYSGQPSPSDQTQTFEVEPNLRLHYFTLGGEWSFDDERAMPKAGASIWLKTNAKDVHLVMRSTTGVKKILVEESFRPGLEAPAIPKELMIEKDSLYTLPTYGTAEERTVILTFPDTSIELYAFTFG